jgi:hypothetical protein
VSLLTDFNAYIKTYQNTYQYKMGGVMQRSSGEVAAMFP